ncbi:MAG: V-type ATP synthase subunit F [Clostridia bacterium]|nr:V-type ATP synthase subunit F [Clostridia bacterium]
MAKICVIGDYDSICGFNALGIDTFVSTERDDTVRTIENLAVNHYVIILITENIALKITDILDKYKSEPLPAIITIPAVSGGGNLGMQYLRKAVEQAVGSADMIFGADE